MHVQCRSALCPGLQSRPPSGSDDNLGRGTGLLCGGDAHLLVAVVECAVVLAHEDIAHDPEGPAWGGHVDAHEGKEALAGDGEDIVVRAEGEVLAAQGDGEVGEGRLLAAVDGVLLAKDARGPRLLRQCGNHLRGARQEGGAAVDDGVRLAGHGRAAELHGVKADLPVGLARQRHVDKLARVMRLVNAAEGELALLRGILLEVKGEDGLVDELLVDHGLEGRRDVVLGDALEAEAEQAVKLAGSEGDVERAEGDLADLRERLSLHVHGPHGDRVLAEDALHGAGAVLDRVLPAVRLEGLGLAVVEPGVQPASEEAAGLARDPEVGGARVEDDLEVLAAHLDGPVKLRVLVVADGNVVPVRGARRRQRLEAPLLLHGAGDLPEAGGLLDRHADQLGRGRGHEARYREEARHGRR
mmetsp:Transcript_51311/g.159019  ORF Transcript_51311/g.159019 Transcript_51311/m.159019 type:complete len:413 (-) Transcript_51311:78-1316(-)